MAAELVDVLEPLGDVLAARNDPGWADLLVDVLGVVHDHHPPGVMIVDLALVAPVAVVMPELGFGAGRVVVKHPVRMHHVALAEHAGQRTLDDGIVEHELELRHQGEQVVAGVVVVVLPNELDEAVEHLPVELGGQLRLKGEVAVGDEGPHLLVGQQLRRRVLQEIGPLRERRDAVPEVELPLVLPGEVESLLVVPDRLPR